MELGGLIGEVGFEGNLTPFLPYLLLGDKIHAGKNTSFGLGKYSIQVLKQEGRNEKTWKDKERTRI